MNKFCQMTKAQLIETAQALIAYANGQPVQYYSDLLGWTDCQTVDTEFPHRPKPPEEPPAVAVSTNVEDY